MSSEAIPFFCFLLVFLFAFASAAEEADVASIDAKTAAKLRRIAELVPPVQINRAFVTSQNANWMKEMPERIQNMPLSGIAIPGSHDSFTASLDYKAELGPSPDLSDTLIKVINFFGKAAKKIIYNWGVTQGYSLTDQLTAGIRYLDFRVAKRKSKNGDFYLLHSLYAQSAKSAFEEVRNYLNSHDKEVVIIDINHFYNMDADDHRRLADMILQMFGNKLVTVRNLNELTLTNLWKTEERVMVFYHGWLHERGDRLWTGERYTSPWLNTNSRSKAVEKLDVYYNLRHDPMEGFWITQGVLTPTANDIVWGVASSLRKKLGAPMCKVFSNWVANKKIGNGGLNIVITDFVEGYNFINTVIHLNRLH